MKKILVLFKTHLDVGFTDFSRVVLDRYNREMIPRAIAVGRELAEAGCPEGFVWTTGSYLPWQYLRQASPEARAEMEEAIRRKWMRWHGLPVTLHSELADRDLFRYGLSLSHRLDEAYGVRTVAAKMTDVPGHTRAIVPLLREAGIEFLHLGVNPASTAPDVPDLFRWRSPEGAEITVMYNKGAYGAFSEIPGTDTGVYFAHTGDNMGPSSAREVLDLYADLHARYPGAEIRAGDLNDLALAVRPVAGQLPVITQELGDTWIHGGGTDPQKMSTYRALLRLARDLGPAERETLYEHLLLVPEHTWGVNEQKWLRDSENYSREHFNAVRHQENYKKMEDSWAEQREYVTAAAQALPEGPICRRALAALTEYRLKKPNFDGMQPVSGKKIILGGWDIRWDDTGAVTYLEKDGRILADEDHTMGRFRYEAFSQTEVEAFKDRYLKPSMRQVDWAVDDFGKRGLERDMPGYYVRDAALKQALTDGESLYLRLAVGGDAEKCYGCPPELVLAVRPEETTVLFDFAWYDKPACRIPEALWLGFRPRKPLTAIRKLGSDIHPLEVVSLGNREMHATEGLLRFGGETLELIDSALIAVGEPSVYHFYNRLPDTAAGIWANLFNNQWGTNFPMWCEGDARFRFRLGGRAE